MHENRNLFLFLIEIKNMHHTRHILPIPRTCIWRRCFVTSMVALHYFPDRYTDFLHETDWCSAYHTLMDNINLYSPQRQKTDRQTLTEA